MWADTDGGRREMRVGDLVGIDEVSYVHLKHLLDEDGLGRRSSGAVVLLGSAPTKRRCVLVLWETGRMFSINRKYVRRQGEIS